MGDLNSSFKWRRENLPVIFILFFFLTGWGGQGSDNLAYMYM